LRGYLSHDTDIDGHEPGCVPEGFPKAELMANFKPIKSKETLEELFKKSEDQPVVIFKHSSTCGISSHVMEMVDEVGRDVHFVVVQDDRDISNEIAERTGRVHQSPQIFVIRDGKPIYHATHYGIDPNEVEKALGKEDQ
jgi:bacillithiol system protein YtxJ